MEVTKPYEFIGFGAMEVTKPYDFIGFGAMERRAPIQVHKSGVHLSRLTRVTGTATTRLGRGPGAPKVLNSTSPVIPTSY